MGVAPETFEPATANFLNLVHPDDRHIIAATHAEMARGACPAPFEYRIIRPDGTIRWIYREVELIRDAGGKPLSMLGTVKDITEPHAARERQAELERELLHSQKLEALGTLAGGIAHDLNNALVPILALTQQIARRTDFGSGDRANLDMVAAAARRATEIAAPAPVFGDSGHLHQVVVNLMTNAAQAIGGERGRISLNLSISAADQLSPSDAFSGAAVRLSITDTGCGMDAETRGRIFDPFFTTKRVGEGTGLGLSVVHGIVKSHGGRIEVESNTGRGTTFVVVLPLYRGENARQAAPASHAYAATGGGSSAG